MKRLSPLVLIAVFGLALLGAAPAPSPESLLKQGNEAFKAGDFARAIQLYELAEPGAADPGEITMNLALAKYARFLKNGAAADLNDAEQLYGCLLDTGDPRRAAALLGLGNCLLQRAGPRNVQAVREAIKAFEKCQEAAQDDQLRADAQYNLERARLLLQQSRKADDEQDPPPEPEDPHDKQPKPPKPPDPKAKPPQDPKSPGAQQKPDGPSVPAQPQPGEKPQETKDQPPPGKGTLRPIPDQPDQPPLTEAEALEHLKQANERIWRERRDHRKGLAKPPAEGVRDW